MNLAEMMMAAGRDCEDDEPGLTDDQQITRLQEYFAQVYAAEPERFEPGQIIWHKNPELADVRRAEAPRIFVGYLPTPIRPASGITDVHEFGSNSATKVLDATFVVLDGDGEASEHFIDTRFYTATKPRSA